MKKVFSKEKFIEVMGIETYESCFIYGCINWVDDCDGMTREEMEEEGYVTDKIWMIEVEDEEEIEMI